MAKYIYKRYTFNITKIFITKTISNTDYVEPKVTGIMYHCNDYTFDSATGYTAGNRNVVPGEFYGVQRFYYDKGLTNYMELYKVKDWAGGTTYKLIEQATYTDFKSKGSYLGEVTAENYTYPTDGESGGYWYVRDRLANNAPTISGTNTNLGNLTIKPTAISYTVTDTDGDSLTVTERVDGVLIRSITVASGSSLTLNLSDDQWLKTRLNTSVNLTIDVNDGKGGTANRTYTLIRKETKIDFQLKTPYRTDTLAKRILLNLDGKIPSSAIVLIEACNNALDATPTWEDITTLCLKGLPYPFKNKTKTNTSAGISFRVKIERGREVGIGTEELYLIGVGGAYD